jgi:hypothetical protein
LDKSSDEEVDSEENEDEDEDEDEDDSEDEGIQPPTIQRQSAAGRSRKERTEA